MSHNRTHVRVATHYGVAVLPAVPVARDKPKVEAAVLLVERWILARLRNRRFFSCRIERHRAAARRTERSLVQEAARCRPQRLRVDRPAGAAAAAGGALRAGREAGSVNIDYHVEFDGHYYSVPHRLVRTEVELRITSTTLEVIAGNRRLASHF